MLTTTDEIDHQNIWFQVKSLEGRLVSANNQINMLSHGMSDKQAQLDMEINNTKVSITNKIGSLFYYYTLK